MKNKKNIMKITIVSIIIVSVILIILAVIFSNSKITASKKVDYAENKKMNIKYIINMNTKNVEKRLKYNNKEDAKAEYLMYEETNKYLNEESKRKIKLQGETIITEMSMEEFFTEVSFNIENTTTIQGILDSLREKDFSVRTNIMAKIEIYYMNKNLIDISNEPEEYKQKYYETMWEKEIQITSE